MYKIPINDLKEKIVASGKLDSTKLDEKIKAKITELSGLISEEGAAHIIANELGIELVSDKQTKLKIKEIYAGMRNVSTVGKVVRKFDVHEFQKGDSTGKVCSLIIGDETGTTRVVFWNEQVDLLQSVNQDDIILVENAYVRENNNNKEIHLGDRGDIKVNPEGEKVEKVRQGTSFERKTIAELNDNTEGVEILGTVVQVFDPRFFTVHPESGRRLREGEEEGVTPALSYVLNAVLDDGTGTIRAVFWKNQTNHLLDKAEEDMAKFKDDLASFESLKTDLLGEQFKLMGRVKKNEMFDRMEFNAQIVEKAKPQEEIEKVEAVIEAIEKTEKVEEVKESESVETTESVDKEE
jgi:replication factor A1